MNTSAGVSHFKTFTDGLLGHANGMSCFNGKFFVVAGNNKVVAISSNKEDEEITYTVTPNDNDKLKQLIIFMRQIQLYYCPLLTEH